jgi:DNA primase
MTSADLREEVKNRIRETADIAQVIGEVVELRKAGSRYTGLCPFHAEKTPSFSVNPQGQFFHCFGCGESGDVFSFMMKYHRLSFPEALKELARRYHIDLPEPRLSDADRKRIRERDLLYRVNREAAAMYRQYLVESPDAESARHYLAQRGVPDEVAETFGIGFTPDPSSAGWSFVTSRLQAMKLPVAAIEKAGLAVKKDRGGYYDRFRDRIMFPIMDVSGQVVAFGGRILGEGQPKYMNSPESPVFDKSRLLFGLFQHRETIRQCRRALVVEGNFDLVLLAVHGINNVVAPLGTALTRAHIRMLRGYCDEVVLLFDGDSAGLKAAMRSVPFFLAEQVDARIAVLPEGHDPDSFVRETGSGGIEGLVEKALPLAEFVFDVLARRHGMTLDGKNRIVSELQQIVAAGDDPVQRSLMVAHFSEMLGITPAQFEAGMRQAPAKKSQAVGSSRESLHNLPRKQRQLIDFLILYPEYFPQLLEAGVENVIASQEIMNIFSILRELSRQGHLTPDRLLVALPEESGARHYVAELLISGDPGSAEDPEDPARQARQMCSEVLQWLQAEMRQKEGAGLQEQINDAQRSGDTELLMKLLARKQEMRKMNDF